VAVARKRAPTVGPAAGDRHTRYRT